MCMRNSTARPINSYGKIKVEENRRNMQENENPFGPQPNLDATPAPEASAPVVDQPVAQPVVDAAPVV